MKAKERHELGSNELADAVSRLGQSLKPYITHILIAVVIVAAAIVWLSSQGKSSEKQHTDALLALPEALAAGGDYRAGENAPKIVQDKIDALDKYILKYPDSPGLPLAKFTLANELYNRALLTWAAAGDPTKVEEDLSRAAMIFKELEHRPDRFGAWSRFGLACVEEMRGKSKEAESMLIALARDNPNSDIELAANERLDRIVHYKPTQFAPAKVEQKPEATKPGAGNQPAVPQQPAGTPLSGQEAPNALAPPPAEPKASGTAK